MRIPVRLISLLLVIPWVLAACNMPKPKQSQNGTDAVKTQMAGTIQAMSSQIAVPSQEVPPTQTLPPAGTQAPSDTPLPVATSTITNTPPATATQIPCDWAQFVSDVTVPDGSVYGPGATFVKTWRIKNIGSCTWNTSYTMVFVTGNAMSGPASVPLTGIVKPGETIDISLSLKAPEAAGAYSSLWMLQNTSGANFGIGDKADKSFYVKIVVAITETPFAVTSVNMTVLPAVTWAGPCPPLDLLFKAEINASAAGTVTYYWEDQAGVKSAKGSVEFTSAGKETVTYVVPIAGAGPHLGTIKIYIDKPNHQYFAPTDYNISCTP